MNIGDHEIARIAEWESVCPGFEREDTIIQTFIEPILNQLKGVDGISLYVFEKGGLSNYFAFFVYDGRAGIKAPPPLVDAKPTKILIGGDKKFTGVAVYLSLLAPVGVIGMSEMLVGADWNSTPRLDLNDIVSINTSCGEVFGMVRSALLGSKYRMLEAAELSRKLPPNVYPDEYCLGNEPWDRYFHALFANTD